VPPPEPLAVTETPGTADPSLLSVTLPVIVFSCAKRDCERTTSSKDKPIPRSSCFTSITVSLERLVGINVGNMYYLHKNFSKQKVGVQIS